MAEPNVRLAREGDQGELLRMWLALFPSHAPDEHVEAIRRYIEGAPNSPIEADLYVYERHDGRAGGFMELSLRSAAEGCWRHSPVGYVEGIWVDDDLRRQGVGSLLVHEAERWAKAHGCWDLASDAKLDNVLSHRFHQGAGFEEVERAVHYRMPLR